MRRLVVFAALVGLVFPVLGSSAQPARAAATDGIPLILLVDVSSSMDDSAGSGSTMSKLDSAKEGMRNAVSDRSANLVGIWTYPTDGDCSPGGYVAGAEPVLRSDSAKLKAIINNLYAKGNTPTGPALQALGDDLVRRGFPRANIVLVSDGESNCGPPPCDVAKGLVDKGFDITVNTIGFSISAAGRDELNCIAGATGGKYVDAENGEELIDELQNQTNPILKITAKSDPQPAMAGGTVALTVTATNTSTQMTIEDVNAVVTFRQDGPKDVTLPAVPPRKKLGNLPPGESKPFPSWNFSLSGVVGDNQAARYRVVVYGRTTDGVLVDGVINIDTSVLEVTPDDWGVKIDGDDQIVIMGDSFSSGEGAEWKRDGNYQRGKCHVSDLSYAQNSPYVNGKDGERYRVKNLACSGAVIQDFYSPQHSDALPQYRQLLDLEVAPRIVFLTIGGNDIEFSSVVTDCVAFSLPTLDGWSDCLSDHSEKGRYGQTSSAIQALSLSPLYEQVWSFANNDKFVKERGGYAPLVVLPYPRLMNYSGKSCDVLDGPVQGWEMFTGIAHSVNAADVKSANELQDALNGRIEEQVAVASDGGSRAIYYAAEIENATFGHTICESEEDSWVVPITYTSLSTGQSFHPTAEGYHAWGRALQQYLKSSAFDFDPSGDYGGGRDRTYCRLVHEIPAKDESATLRFGVSDTVPRDWPSSSPKTTYTVNPELDGRVVESPFVQELQKCDYRWIEVRLAPGSPGVVKVHSSPVVLASFTADEEGYAEALIQVPGWIEPGVHTLTVEGWDAEGNPVVYSTTIKVTEPTPWFVWGAAVLAGVALVVVFALLLLRRFRFRKVTGDQAGAHDGRTPHDDTRLVPRSAPINPMTSADTTRTPITCESQEVDEA